MPALLKPPCSGSSSESDRTRQADQAPGEQVKRLATLRAQLAFGGHVVHELSAGGYLVTWRGYSRHCEGLDDLEAHARRVGAIQ